MSEDGTYEVGEIAWLDRLAARRAGWSRGAVAIASEPDLRCLGSDLRGQELFEGRLHMGGALVNLHGNMDAIWTSAAPSASFEAARQGFVWLEDLAALGSRQARDLGQRWVLDWLKRYGKGAGPGWTPVLTARRLIRLMDLAPWLLTGPNAPQEAELGRAVYRHTKVLSRRYGKAPAGIARLEAICALIVAAANTDDPVAMVGLAPVQLNQECHDLVDGQGAVASRNPQDLQWVFLNLTRAAEALEASGMRIGAEHAKAIQNIAPVLRTLRHANGQLGRFHGGGRGSVARIDAALAGSGVKAAAMTGLAMGFARLARGRTTVLVDAAAPALGSQAGTEAHASTLAFELTSAQHALIVNCGAGSGFGPEWHRAARSTPSHTTLAIEGQSSSRLGSGARGREVMKTGPSDVQVDTSMEGPVASLVAAHNGYAESHGLIHVRRLDLDDTGRRLTGEDVLTAVSEQEKRRFERIRAEQRPTRQGGEPGIGFAIRFHLHPDVTVDQVQFGESLRLTLPNGEIWVFRHTSSCTIRLDPSVYLENTRPAPRACQQIVLSGRASATATSVRWQLAKDEAMPDFLRQGGPEETPKTDDPA